MQTIVGVSLIEPIIIPPISKSGSPRRRGSFWKVRLGGGASGSMEAAAQLTPGGVRAIADGAMPADIQPVLQVLEVRQVRSTKSAGASANPNPSERYLAMLSDGVNTHQSMLATEFSPAVRDGALRVGTVVHLNEFICKTIQGKR